MAQLKITNNTNQRLELMLQDKNTKKMKGVALGPKEVKFIDAVEVTQQLNNLAGRKFITTIEVA